MSSYNAIYPSNYANTPEIKTSAGVALSVNPERKAWSVVNLGTNPLFVRLGGTASTTVFHIPLKAGSGNDDGTGGTCGQSCGLVFQGEITVAGTSPRFTIYES